MSGECVVELLREIRDLLRRAEDRATGRRVPRDDRHVALVRAIAGAARGLAFTSAELIAHAQVEGALRDALVACDALNARRLGKLLRRIEGVEIGGLVVERVGESGEGVVWVSRVSEARETRQTLFTIA